MDCIFIAKVLVKFIFYFPIYATIQQIFWWKYKVDLTANDV